MSKINEIENAIVQIEVGRFQKMVDQYLYRKYKYDNIHSLGSQQGTDKTTKVWTLLSVECIVMIA